MLYVLLIAVFAAAPLESPAQNWLERVGKNAAKRAEERAKKKVEDKVDQTVDKSVDEAFDAPGKALRNDGGQKPAAANAVADTAAPDTAPSTAPPAAAEPPAAQTLEMAYAKSDFVPGDEIFFDDDLAAEQIGEFPSKWDLVKGVAEIAQLNGRNVILYTEEDSEIAPLMTEMKNYLPDVFTLEFDFWVNGNTYENSHCYIVYLMPANENGAMHQITVGTWAGEDRNVSWRYKSTGGEMRNGTTATAGFIGNSWNHFALSFNKRAMKIYINGTRAANIPNCTAPGHLKIQGYRPGGYIWTKWAICGIRLAKGAVPLYDRMLTDGKFITYGITFDVGKATIKPESMGEINRIVRLMNENPALKFSVEGHTDSTGSAAGNQTLSESRAQAIVAKLVEQGIAADRLTAAGKGQNTPIADNATDEGRAKNRRVEFVKI